MKKKIDKISDLIKIEKIRNDRQLIIFLVCVVIAGGLWFLNALSKDYNTTISYPVKYVNAPNNQFLSNEPPSRLDFKVNAHGFTLLRHKLSLSFSPVVLNLSAMIENLTPSTGTYTVSTRTLIRRISAQVSKEITISDIQPETLLITLDSLKTKSVPVRADMNLEFQPQFNLKGKVNVEPEYVNITGPSEIISQIEYVTTKNKTLGVLGKDIIKEMSINHPENTTVNPDHVKVAIAVDKFTEKELKVPVHIQNKPDEIIVKLFPSEISLVFVVGLSEFEEITPEDFHVTADYSRIQENSESIEVTLDSLPDNIEMVRISPETLEFLIESK